jgi:hypothetical protein
MRHLWVSPDFGSADEAAQEPKGVWVPQDGRERHTEAARLGDHVTIAKRPRPTSLEGVNQRAASPCHNNVGFT